MLSIFAHCSKLVDIANQFVREVETNQFYSLLLFYQSLNFFHTARIQVLEEKQSKLLKNNSKDDLKSIHTFRRKNDGMKWCWLERRFNSTLFIQLKFNVDFDGNLVFYVTASILMT